MADEPLLSAHELTPLGSPGVEVYGDYCLFVEESDSDSRYRIRYTQTAYVCKKGCTTRLFQHNSQAHTGHLLHKGGSRLRGDLNSRDVAFKWLMETIPEAKAAYDAAQLRAAEEARRVREEEIVSCIGACPFEYLTRTWDADLGTDRLARLVGVPTRSLNELLVKTGFQTRISAKWTPCRGGLSRGHFGPQIRWTAIGAKAIWETALTTGLTVLPLDELLAKLRKHRHWLPQWLVLDEAIKRSQGLTSHSYTQAQ